MSSYRSRALPALLAMSTGIALFASACTNESESTSDGAAKDDVVSMSLARAVAGTYPLAEDRPEEVRHVKDVSVLEDDARRPAMYAFNFEEGGWIVVSATLDYAPVLAFSDEGVIDVNHLPPGPDEWAADMRATIQTLRDGSAKGIDSVARERLAHARGEATDWKPVLASIQTRRVVDDAVITRAVSRIEARDEALVPSVSLKPQGPCQTCENEPKPKPEPGPPAPICTRVSDTWRGPLLRTYWSQGCGYNEFAPGGGSSANCFAHVAGCGPVAGAQLIRYWQHAKNRSYAWSSMYDGLPGQPLDNDPRARLIRDVGDAAHSTYGIVETGTKLENLEQALKDYGYSTSIGYLGQTDPVGSEVASGRPVIVRGAKASGSAHIWVADGTRAPVWGPTGCRPPAGEHTFYHYNWGWGYSAQNPTGSNGWYLGNSFGDFNLGRRFITARPM